MSISQLDLVLLGNKGLTSRLASVERAAARPAVVIEAAATTTTNTPTGTRTNILNNPSFEHYDRGQTSPKGWTALGYAQVSTATAAYDGEAVVAAPGGGEVEQQLLGGSVLAAGSLVLSVWVRATTNDQKVYLRLAHAPGYTVGNVMRLDFDGGVVQTFSVPNDGRWYRFYCGYILSGGAGASVQIVNPGPGTLYFDAAKAEYESGTAEFLVPTMYIPEGTSTASHIRNLAADNITAGTLNVGGAGSTNPRIAVSDAAGQEVVTIGDPQAGTRGIEVKGTAGMRVTGTGSVEVTGGGNVEVAGGGGLTIADGGNIALNEGGSLLVDGGHIDVNGPEGIRVTGGGGLKVEDAGNIEVGNNGQVRLRGTGKVVAGVEGANRTEMGAGGVALFDEAGTQNLLLSSVTGKVHIYGDAYQFEPGGQLAIANGQVWADDKGLWAIDSNGNPTFGVCGVDDWGWGGLDLGRGDVVIGTQASYVWWDADAGGDYGVLKLAGDGSALTNLTGDSIVSGSISGVSLVGGTGNAVIDESGIWLRGRAGSLDGASGKTLYWKRAQDGTTAAKIYSESYLVMAPAGFGDTLHIRAGADGVGFGSQVYLTAETGLGTVNLLLDNGREGSYASISADAIAFYSTKNEGRLAGAKGWNVVNKLTADHVVPTKGVFPRLGIPTALPTGAGLEVFYANFTQGGEGYIQSYDRTTNTTRPLVIYSSGVSVDGGSLSVKNGLFERSDAAGTLRYRIRNAAEGSWSWRFQDGSAGDYFVVEFPTGNGWIRGTLIQGSDRRLKEDIKAIDQQDALAKVRALKPSRYRRIGDAAENEYGLIAQEVQEVVPAAVREYDSLLGLHEMGIVSLALAAIQNLADRLDALEQKLT